ncbi:MAG: bifunctional methylenetetrahydrofolate dehydrogenase/methenyltetrahydrofolate cyclohydrolase FolD [Spirochaetales bacterium]|nr:bifunctional methylenetetrahydrofolate dehydrogenase/methenyltetrahydrofolate cyclohydrolase FolD [Spirochaetales bacterium]
MVTKIIDGKQIAEAIRQQLKKEVAELSTQHIIPGLGVILVGDDPASRSYVTAKEKACGEMGIYSRDHRLSSDTTEEELIELVNSLNIDPAIHGILVQLPLPAHIDEKKVLETIVPEKDVDGFSPINVGRMVLGQKTFLPCTPHGVLKLLEYSNILTEGKHVVIVGRSNIVGKPLANMLIQKSSSGNATVTVCHSRTRDIGAMTRQADIVIAAVGSPALITKDMVKEGAVVIDVGVNRVTDPSRKRGFRLCGDVDFDSLVGHVSHLTPVPGGVGPLTITMLLFNTIESAKAAGE